MGIVNVTPDSFSDGGDRLNPDVAASAAVRMTREGAEILDIGGESTRPGHVTLPAEDEWERLAPVFARLAEHHRELPPISVDTWKADVASKAIVAGAAIVNDVWGFQRDPRMASVTADSGCAAILMHNRHAVDETVDIVEDVMRFLERSLEIATRAGVPSDRIVLDPGLGFGKSFAQSFQVLAALPRFRTLGFPLLLGLSRKGFIGSLTEPPLPAKERGAGTLAGNVFGALSGADIIRVHDVAPHLQAVRLLERLALAA
jgi:dihydropteroate synthase